MNYLNKFKIKYISVGHKANLNNFHELALTLSINDENKIEEILKIFDIKY